MSVERGAEIPIVGARFFPYEVFGRLGTGEMGEVYRARGGRFGHEVAINDSLREYPEINRDSSASRRKRALPSPSTRPNIVTVYNLGATGPIHWIGRVNGSQV